MRGRVSLPPPISHGSGNWRGGGGRRGGNWRGGGGESFEFGGRGVGRRGGGGDPHEFGGRGGGLRREWDEGRRAREWEEDDQEDFRHRFVKWKIKENILVYVW